MDSQADKTVARSISHLSLRYTATTTISLFFRFSVAPFITAILVVRARHSRHTRAARRQSAAPVRAATSNANSKSRETGAAFASALPPRPATCSVSFALSNLHGFLRARPVEG